MDFTLDQTQREIADVTASILERAATRPSGERWTAIVDGGLLALALPEQYGGDGLGLGEIGVVLAEIGRRALTEPVLTTLALGALPLARCGTRQQQQAFLPGVAKEGRVLSAALHEPGRPLPARPRTLARRDGDRFLVTGTGLSVPDAQRAERVLVPVTIPDAGTGVLLVDPHAPGAQLSAVPSAVPDAYARLSLEQVAVPVADLLGDRSDGSSIRDLYQVAVVAAALVADGLLAGALALTAEHVRTREQFGRPLATLQAVAQQIADVYVASRILHLAAWSACWRMAENRSSGADPEVAAYWVGEYLRPALATCHHLHGGLGLDDRYPLHRFSALAADLTRFVGGPGRGLERLGDELFDSPGSPGSPGASGSPGGFGGFGAGEG